MATAMLAIFTSCQQAEIEIPGENSENVFDKTSRNENQHHSRMTGIRLMTDLQDWTAARNAGVDTDKLVSYLTLDDDTFQFPEEGRPGRIMKIDSTDYVILYEGELLVEEKCVVNATLTLSNSEGYEYSFPVNNLPLTPGEFVTLSGLHLTSEVTFHITISPEFDGDHQKEE